MEKKSREVPYGTCWKRQFQALLHDKCIISYYDVIDILSIFYKHNARSVQ